MFMLSVAQEKAKAQRRRLVAVALSDRSAKLTNSGSGHEADRKSSFRRRVSVESGLMSPTLGNGHRHPLSHDAERYPFRHKSVVELRSSFVDNCEDFTDELSDNIIAMYDDIERSRGVKIEQLDRLRYFKEFSAKKSKNGHLDAEEVKFLMMSGLQLDIADTELDDLISKKIAKEEGGNIVFDFENFVQLVIDVVEKQNSQVKKLTDDPASRKLESWFPLDPETFQKQTWDLICLMILLFCSFYVPYTIAFVNSPPDGSLSPLDYLDIAIDCIFMIDIGLSFVTAYDSQGFLVKDLRQIARNYINTWFLPDLAGSFPFDLVIAACLASQGSSVNLAAMKLIRMLRLVRAIKFINKLNKLKDQEGFEGYGSVIGIFNAVFVIIFTSHLLGCFFTMLAVAEPDLNWIIHYNPDLVDADNWTRYMLAMYWATVSVTTMGYGDVIPITHSERSFAIVVALSGAVVFSYCMGNISSLISQVAGVDDRFQETLRSVLEYLQFREVSVDLRRKVKNYYSHCWRRSAVPYNERQILSELPSSLRAQVLKDFGAKISKDIPILRAYDDECIGFIASHLKPIILGKDEVVYLQGEQGSDMYFLVQGAVTLHFGKPQALTSAAQDAQVPADEEKQFRSTKTIQGGDTFGEIALFPDLWDGYRAETATADSIGTAFMLSCHDVEVIKERYPKLLARLRELAILKQVEIKTYSFLNNGATLGSRPQERTKHCKMKLCSGQIYKELLFVKETEILPKYAGSDASEVIALFGHTESHGEGELKKMSCVVSEKGEILCIQHSLDGISMDSPKSLGFVWPEQSTIKALSVSSTQEKFLFECSMLLFEEQWVDPRSTAESDRPEAERETQTAATHANFEYNVVQLFGTYEDVERWRLAVTKWAEPRRGLSAYPCSNGDLLHKDPEKGHKCNGKHLQENLNIAIQSSLEIEEANNEGIDDEATRMKAGLGSGDDHRIDSKIGCKDLSWEGLRGKARRIRTVLEKIECLAETKIDSLNNRGTRWSTLKRLDFDLNRLQQSADETVLSLQSAEHEEVFNMPSQNSDRDLHDSREEIERLRACVQALMDPLQRLSETINQSAVERSDERPRHSN